MTVRNTKAQEMIEARAGKLVSASAAKGSPFPSSSTRISCIKCGVHRPHSQLKHWRGTFYKCIDAEQCK